MLTDLVDACFDAESLVLSFETTIASASPDSEIQEDVQL